MDLPIRIMVIPDCQVKQGVPVDHLEWAGKFAADEKPDVIINIGDFADMPSLSTHDKVGSKYFEGKRYTADIEAAKSAMKVFLNPIREEQQKLVRCKVKRYNPRLVMLHGNHEHRITRAVANSPMLEGLVSTDDLKYETDWEVHKFLHPVFINGVGFNHYWPTGLMGRPASSTNVLVNKMHMSCVAGHQQGKQVSYGKKADGSLITAIIAGSFYQHEEDYMDKLSNAHWRGIVMLDNVANGSFDEQFISIDTLRKKYSK